MRKIFLYLICLTIGWYVIKVFKNYYNVYSKTKETNIKLKELRYKANNLSKKNKVNIVPTPIVKQNNNIITKSKNIEKNINITKSYIINSLEPYNIKLDDHITEEGTVIIDEPPMLGVIQIINSNIQYIRNDNLKGKDYFSVTIFLDQEEPIHVKINVELKEANVEEPPKQPEQVLNPINLCNDMSIYLNKPLQEIFLDIDTKNVEYIELEPNSKIAMFFTEQLDVIEVEVEDVNFEYLGVYLVVFSKDDSQECFIEFLNNIEDNNGLD